MLKTRKQGDKKLQVEAAPAIEYIERLMNDNQLDYRNLDDLLPVSARTYWRWKKAGWINVNHADKLAIHFGLHPAELWQGWFEYFAEGEEQ